MILSKKNIADISSLSISEGLSMLILLFTLPFITRIYDPADFGNFEKYVVLIAIATNVCLLNFEFKIYDYKTKKEQTLSIIICLLFTLSISLIIFLFTILLNLFIPISIFFSLEIIFLIFVWLFFVTMSNIVLTFFSSYGKFKYYSFIRLISTIILVSSQIIFGLLEYNFLGFIYAIILQNILICCFGLFPIFNQIKKYGKSFSLTDMLNHIKANDKIILFSFPGNLVNRLTQSLPIFFLSYFNPIFLGYFSFSNQLLNYPLKLFNGIGNMFKKEFNDEVRSYFTYKVAFKKYFKIFSIISVILLVGVYSLSDILIPILFGDKWIDSIIILKYLVLLVAVRFVVAGLSPVMILDYLPKYGILLQIFYLILTSTFLFVGFNFFNGHMPVIISYVLSSIIFYITYFLVMKYFSNKRLNFKNHGV